MQEAPTDTRSHELGGDDDESDDEKEALQSSPPRNPCDLTDDHHELSTFITITSILYLDPRIHHTGQAGIA